MEETILKRTWAEIDLDALKENYRQVRSCTSPTTKICCVVKADGYGHGAVPIARTLEALGADFFGVSNLEEALELRQSGAKIPILILGYTPPEYAKVLAAQQITQCVYSPEYAGLLSARAKESSVTVDCHLKVDTGMNRLGFSARRTQASALLDICRLPGLRFTGIFTHFAVSDEGKAGRDFTLGQYESFLELTEALAHTGQHFALRHCANSGAVLDYPETHLDMVRAGIVLYGLYPSAQSNHRISLRPVMSLRSVVAGVKEIFPGDSVSYGRIFTAEKPMRVAAVPVGYADGYPRILGKHRASVIIGGKHCRITGRVCMDQIIVDVSDLPHVRIGDDVTLIGTAGNATVTADELAAYEDSINYEVVCDIGKRVPRVFLSMGRVDSTMNHYGKYLHEASR